MKPTKQELETLYLVEMKTSDQIAIDFGVSRTSVKRWLHSYQIPVRPSGSGLANRGIEPPSRETLYHLVHVEHKSYRDIAEMYGVDCTAVPYWLKKHQIELPTIWGTRRKGTEIILPTQEALSQMYLEEGMTLDQIATQHNVTRIVITRLCKEFGIPLRPDGFNGGIRFTCTDGHLVRSTYEQKVDNWLYEHGIPHRYEPRLPFDHRWHADFLANGWYIEIWGVTDSKDYAQRKARKISLYHAHQVPLIQLSVDSFSNRRKDSWKKRLALCLTSQNSPLPLQSLPLQLEMNL